MNFFRKKAAVEQPPSTPVVSSQPSRKTEPSKFNESFLTQKRPNLYKRNNQSDCTIVNSNNDLLSPLDTSSLSPDINRYSPSIALSARTDYLQLSYENSIYSNEDVSTENPINESLSENSNENANENSNESPNQMDYLTEKIDSMSFLNSYQNSEFYNSPPETPQPTPITYEPYVPLKTYDSIYEPYMSSRNSIASTSSAVSSAILYSTTTNDISIRPSTPSTSSNSKQQSIYIPPGTNRKKISSHIPPLAIPYQPPIDLPKRKTGPGSIPTLATKYYPNIPVGDQTNYTSEPESYISSSDTTSSFRTQSMPFSNQQRGSMFHRKEAVYPEYSFRESNRNSILDRTSLDSNRVSSNDGSHVYRHSQQQQQQNGDGNRSQLHNSWYAVDPIQIGSPADLDRWSVGNNAFVPVCPPSQKSEVVGLDRNVVVISNLRGQRVVVPRNYAGNLNDVFGNKNS